MFFVWGSALGRFYTCSSSIFTVFAVVRTTTAAALPRYKSRREQGLRSARARKNTMKYEV